MEIVTILLMVFALVFFLIRYVRKRMSLDFMSMVISLLAVVSVVMDTTVSDNERLVLFFVPFATMMLSAVAMLEQKKW